jgi:hypothetical protein
VGVFASRLRISALLFDDRYYAFDDDYMRGQGVTGSSDEEVQDEGGGKCRRVSDHKLSFRNCNVLYELPLLECNVKYLK